MTTEARNQAKAVDAVDWYVDYADDPRIPGNAFERGWDAHVALSSTPEAPTDQQLQMTYNRARKEAFEIGASEGLEFSARAVFGHIEALRAALSTSKGNTPT